MIEWPIQSIACNAVAVGSRLWSSRRGMHVTVVVKSTFALAPDGPMVLLDPAPLSVGDAASESEFVRTPFDLAPYIPRADVLYSGGPLQYAHPSPARLSVHRGTRIMDAMATDAGDKATGFGPLPSESAMRRHLLRGRDPSFLSAAVPHFPDDFDWSYFQAAPLPQRVDRLEGFEVLLLEGLHPTVPRLSVRLPSVRAEARVEHAAALGLPDGAPLELRIDTVFLDGRAGTCSVISRGVAGVPHPEHLAKVRLHAGVSTMDAPVRFPGLLGSPLTERTPQAKTQPIAVFASRTEETFDLRGVRGPSGPALPFADASEASEHSSPAPSVPGAPWSRKQAQPVPRPAPDALETLALGARPPLDPESLAVSPSNDPERTAAVGSATQLAAMALPALPFSSQFAGNANVSDVPIAGAPWSGVAAAAPPKPTGAPDAATLKLASENAHLKRKRGTDLRAEIELMRARVAAAEALPLAKFAALKADLWAGHTLEDVLARHGVSAATWRAAEEAWTDAIAREAAQGRSELAQAFADGTKASLGPKGPGTGEK